MSAHERLNTISRQLNKTALNEVLGFKDAAHAPDQVWFVAGVSDGMGLATVVAAIEAGLLKHGVGVYWEPPHLLEVNSDGTPVSPIHRARLENAQALEAFAKERGANFKVISADVILAPGRDLKGQQKGEVKPLPAEIVSAVEAARAAAPVKDIIFINSVAFGKWMCPREGQDAIRTPTVDFEGCIVESQTKPYHVRGYEETLDTMGRNHIWMVEDIRGRGWLGPKSVSAFFTWAGGSQNVASLEGIYGKGALGDAKMIAEADVTRFRLEHGLTFGAHAIVRLPAFLSAALMGIPGGGLFGLVSRRILEQEGAFDDIPELASKMVRLMFGPEWIRENPLSQVELDHGECLYLDVINAAMANVQQRIEQEMESGAAMPFSPALSRRVLNGFAPEGWQQMLKKFVQPDVSVLTSADINPQMLGEAVSTHTVAEELGETELKDLVSPLFNGSEPTWTFGVPVNAGDKLLTYLAKTDGALIATVLNSSAQPVVRGVAR